MRESIRAAGAGVLYLPASSPDLNPIEQVFAKLKTLLRQIGARTKKALWDAIDQLTVAFSLDECKNYILNAGYEYE